MNRDFIFWDWLLITDKEIMTHFTLYLLNLFLLYIGAQMLHFPLYVYLFVCYLLERTAQVTESKQKVDDMKIQDFNDQM